MTRIAQETHAEFVASSLSFAVSALDAIGKHRLAAEPHNYAFWYVYFEGADAAFVRAVDTKLCESKPVTQSDIDRLAERYLPELRDVLHTLGDGFGRELSELLTVFDRAAHTASGYDHAMADAIAALPRSNDRESVARILAALQAATREAERQGRLLIEQTRSSLSKMTKLKASLDAVRSESRLDALTGLCNRRTFDREIETLIAQTRSSDSPLSLMIVDIDHFKSFNDRYGHRTGDDVIRLVARVIGNSIKGSDLAGRYGGEEFVVAMPATDLGTAVGLAGRVRIAISANELRKRSSGEKLCRITLSAGVAQLQNGETREGLLERADARLYDAKRSGRDRVVWRALAAGDQVENSVSQANRQQLEVPVS